MGDLDNRLWIIECTMRDAKSTAELLMLMKKYKESLTPAMWAAIFRSKHFTPRIFKEFESVVPWNYVALFQVAPEEYIEKYFDQFDLYEISCFYPLSASLIKKHYYQLSIDRLVENERLDKAAHDLVMRIYEKYKDNPSFHKRWDANLQKCKTFCPKNFRRRYTDYNGDTPFPSYKPLIFKDKEPQKQNIIEKVPAQPKKKVPDPNKYLGKSKAELKAILAERKVRVYYHDTLEILRNKCAESEE